MALATKCGGRADEKGHIACGRRFCGNLAWVACARRPSRRSDRRSSSIAPEACSSESAHQRGRGGGTASCGDTASCGGTTTRSLLAWRRDNAQSAGVAARQRGDMGRDGDGASCRAVAGRACGKKALGEGLGRSSALWAGERAVPMRSAVRVVRVRGRRGLVQKIASGRRRDIVASWWCEDQTMQRVSLLSQVGWL